MFNDRHNNLTQTKDYRKQLRNNLTPPEARLWVYIKGSQLGYKFRRQNGIDKFILDFYCPEKQLALEVDGGTHNNAASYAYDQSRTEFLNSKGIKVLRFTNKEIMNNLEGVLERIKQHLNHPVG